MDHSKEFGDDWTTSLDGAHRADGLQLRAQIRQTIARARAAIATSSDRTARSQLLLARADALVEVSDRVRQASADLRAELHPAVTAYALAARAQGVSPERMLVLMKTAVREATPSDLDAADALALMDDAVRWSIDAYYHVA